ncbi:MAG: hypothetical protein J5I99_09175 [Verrucomicrobia bacterium]|nr:hypothetical protein [Kiritimatiellia bacterium]MCO6401384.1 hypothetical protein [Verrucomicrobiota bacterium]
MKPWVLIAVLCLAVAIWVWRLLPGAGPTESDLRNTTGVTAEAVGLRFVPHGVEVSCRVGNSTARTAMQVVLAVAVENAAGETLAVNPLAGVSELPGGGSREVAFLVPLRTPPAGARGRVTVALVRWRDS